MGRKKEGEKEGKGGREEEEEQRERQGARVSKPKKGQMFHVDFILKRELWSSEELLLRTPPKFTTFGEPWNRGWKWTWK